MGSRVIKARFFRRAAAVLAAALLFCAPAGADPSWPEDTEGQRALKGYMVYVDSFLREQGELNINSLFEAYTGFEVFGITSQPDAMTPEGVEITAQLFRDGINSIQVRVNYIPRFSQIAAAFLRALNPEGMTMAEAKATPDARAKQAMNNPDNSFEDTVEPLNGTTPRVYYAYYPNQYHDGVNWIQMTIIFPLAGSWDGETLGGGATATKGPDTYSDHADDYEGYYSQDDYTHYDFFTTPTPEPDSAAGDGFPMR